MISIENYFGDKNENIQRVLKEFGKTSKDLNQDIEIIKTWLQTQPHLPEISRDELIINMLIKSKFSIEKCKKSLDMYYTLRTLVPEMYENKNPKLPNMEYMFNSCYYLPLPKLTENGYRVTFIKTHKDADVVDIYDVIAHRYNVMEIKFLEDFVIGDIYVEDLANVTLASALKVTPVALKKAATLFENAYNVRMKAYHFINAPSYFEAVFTLLKQVLSKKLADRLHTHKSIDSLKKHIPTEILPIEYGGSEYNMDELKDIWRNKFIQYQDRFDELEKMKTDESKRPSPVNNDDILGYYGNFKRLDVD